VVAILERMGIGWQRWGGFPLKIYRAYCAMTYLMRLGIKGDWTTIQHYFSSDVYYKLRGLDLQSETLESLGLSEDSSQPHVSSGNQDLDICLRSLPITHKDSVLDIGCGKGGALITLSKYPFHHVDGLEISDSLVAIAKKNFRKLSLEKIRLFCSDAATFTDLNEYNHIYMYNPFPHVVMMSVISNINNSLQTHPRQITIIYKNPVCHDVIISDSNFKVIKKFDHSAQPFWIYKNTSASTQ
jgi:SAM-dependent methyltransferase